MKIRFLSLILLSFQLLIGSALCDAVEPKKYKNFIVTHPLSIEEVGVEINIPEGILNQKIIDLQNRVYASPHEEIMAIKSEGNLKKLSKNLKISEKLKINKLKSIKYLRTHIELIQKTDAPTDYEIQIITNNCDLAKKIIHEIINSSARTRREIEKEYFTEVAKVLKAQRDKKNKESKSMLSKLKSMVEETENDQPARESLLKGSEFIKLKKRYDDLEKEVAHFRERSAFAEAISRMPIDKPNFEIHTFPKVIKVPIEM